MKDWGKVKKALYNRVGKFAVVDWFELDKFLGTHVKRIYIYYRNYIISEKPYSEADAEWLRKFMPVVDLTEGRPYPEEFEKIPRHVAIIGRLNLMDLNLPE